MTTVDEIILSRPTERRGWMETLPAVLARLSEDENSLLGLWSVEFDAVGYLTDEEYDGPIPSRGAPLFECRTCAALVRDETRYHPLESVNLKKHAATHLTERTTS